MQLTAKDARWRPGSAAEVARRAAALRDALKTGSAGKSPGARLAARATAGPTPGAGAPVTGEDRRPPRRTRGYPAGGRPRHPSATAATCLVHAGLTGLVLAGLVGFAPAPHQVGVPSITSSAPAQAGSPATGHRAPAGSSSPAAGQLVRAPAAEPGAGDQADLAGTKPAANPRHAPRRPHRAASGPVKAKPGKQKGQGKPGRQKDKGNEGASVDGTAQALTG
jgi:hypothetical protein